MNNPPPPLATLISKAFALALTVSILPMGACTQQEPYKPTANGTPVATNSKAGTRQNGSAEPASIKKSKTERSMAAVWAAFNSRKYDEAIRLADEIVDEFQGTAIVLERRLQNKHASVPVGRVSEGDKVHVYANGLLNDVPTCLYLKGRSAEALGRKDEARKAYEAAEKYTYARTWDPQGWFWSPADGAVERLEILK